MKKLLKEIRDNNVLLEVVDGQLKVFASESQIDPALIAAIRENKKELVQFLTNNDNMLVEDMAIPALPQADSYPLSPAQQRLWVLSQFREGNIAYNIPGVYVLEGALDVMALEQAFRQLPARHEILRTVFREDDKGEIRQFILPADDARFQLRQIDLQQEVLQSARLQSLVAEEVAQPFDLAGGPLLRGVLFRLSENKWAFAATLHHIISDAWSMEVLVRELLLFYNAAASGVAAPLPPLRIHYKDYAAWQRSQQESAVKDGHRAYWLQQFEGELPVLALPADHTRPAVKTYNGGTVGLHISAVLANRLQACCQEHGASLFMGLMAVLNALFYRYTGQEDIIIGSSKSGRDHIELENQIGFYLNTLALRNRFSGADSFRQLLTGVRQVTLEAYEHQSYPFDELIDELSLQRDTSRSALFDVIVGFQQADVADESSKLGAVKVSRYEAWEERFNKFDLTFLFAAGANGIQVNIGYNSDIYNKDTVTRMAGHFEQLLATALAHPDTALYELDYLNAAEKQQLLETFSHATNGYPSEKTIVDLFQQQVSKTPDAPALAFNDTVLSYRELDNKSDQLASYLLAQHHILPDEVVGIMLDRSENMIIAILGILKAGGAYVAIEPDQPKARKAFIMQDTAIKVLITQTDYVFELDYYSGGIYAIDIQLEDNMAPVKPVVDLHPANLAYVLYTSGSTGQPKGVMISHRSLVDYSYGVRAKTNIGSCKTFGLVSTISADLGNTVIYTSILMGGCLRIFSSSDIMSASRLSSAHVDCMKIVPSHWKALQEPDRLFVPGKCLIFGGEQLTPDVLTHIREHNGKCEVYNHYGPSEATIGKLLRRIDVAAPRISLGMPFCNGHVYVLDNQQRPCPIGVAGEICISGDGLAAGYLNQPELTASRFVSNPYIAGELIYKTGDLGRWLPDGSIAFLGRKDDQVKIRGYRIELDEITEALQEHPSVDTAVVLARDSQSGERELAAYYVASLPLGAEELRTFLSKSLPSYMLPRYFVQLDAMPITSNGKINRKLLPDPNVTGNADEASYIAPRNTVELQLAAIWQEVLGKERIGIKDNFFELGGHSLKATRLASQVHRKFNVKIDFHDLFTSTTLEEQAQLIAGTQQTLFERIHPAPVQRYYPLSSSQRRLWVLSQFRESNIAYNVPGIYLFDGIPNREALAHAFDQLILRHEILRTVFREDEEGTVRQFILPAEALGFGLQYHDLRHAAEQETALQQLLQQETGQPFDLATGPLVRAALICLADDRWVFAYTMHHIISDGWSTGILLKELLLFYNAFHERNAYPALPALRIQYKDYAVWQQEQLQGDAFNRHRDYWLQQFTGELPVLDLPGDRPRPAAKTYNGGTVLRSFDPAVVKKLRELTIQHDASLFMGLLAAVNILLYRHTGQQDVIIGSPVAGRGHADLDDQIGFYLNTLALRTRFQPADTYLQLLENVRSLTLDAYEHQSYPFDELLNGLKMSRDMSRTALFDVLIDLHNTRPNFNAEGQAAKDLSIRPFSAGGQVISKFDLTFMFIEAGDELAISLEYNSDIYTKSTAEHFCNRLAILLSAIAASPEMPLQELPCMEQREREQLLSAFNDIPLNYTERTDVLTSFKKQVAQHPDHIAVVFEQSQLTYAA
ncbi:non-ribosomal peptide synthetase, partial [Chitinophaga sp. Cy-1792]|uniref:non-ribosomal peptide synthetase n=1 Tax=Chitinophaga sp. Cy-1792 TaxID=2608339 RepID=UPI00141EC95A